MAPLLSCLTDSERPWDRVPVGLQLFPSLWHLMASYTKILTIQKLFLFTAAYLQYCGL